MEDKTTIILATIGLALMIASAIAVTALGHHTALPAWSIGFYAAALLRHYTSEQVQ